MANLAVCIALLAMAAFAAVAGQNLIAPRIINGVPIDTLRRFPHHVTIKNLGGYKAGSICGGSILNDRWVLTSAFCVDSSSRLELQFERLYSNNTVGSYSLLENSEAVRIYPTYYDDIALVKLSARLIFSDVIKPVSITSQSLAQLENKLAVLPGFDANSLNGDEATSTAPSQQLAYAMLTVISNSKCKQYYSSEAFDEYLQLCTLGYSNNPNAPCVTDYGSGLLAGWPAKSELIGIYSRTSSDCSTDYPGVYTNVAKYASWIKNVIAS